MSTKFPLISLALTFTLAAVGCEAPDLPSLPVVAAVADETTPEPEPQPTGDVGVNGTIAPPMEKPVTKTPRKFIASDPIKGRRSRAVGGYVGTTVKAGFYAKYQLMIQSIDHDLQIYSAAQGLDITYPKSHEQFMKEIIEPMGVALPELDAPVEYIFVPEQGEKGLQIRLKPDYPGDIWPEGANPADAADDVPEPVEQPNQPNQPGSEPTSRAVGTEGVGAAAGVAPLDLQ